MIKPRPESTCFVHPTLGLCWTYTSDPQHKAGQIAGMKDLLNGACTGYLIFNWHPLPNSQCPKF